MSKKIYLMFLFLISILISCQKDLDNTNSGSGEIQKQDFYIETRKLGDFSSNYEIKKTGKISSSQNITLNSNAVGRVLSLMIKEGENVSEGQALAILEDNIGSYSINLDRAKNSLDRAKINYDSTELTLNKQIFDSEINLRKLQNNLETLKKDQSESLKKASSDLENSKYDGLDSKSALELEKLDNSIEKMELDYSNKLVVDNENIESFKSNLKNDYNSLVLVLDDLIEFSDSLLSLTDLHKDDNKLFRDFLGAKDTQSLTKTKDLLMDLINFRKGNFSNLKFDNLSNEEIFERLNSINIGYEKTKNFLASFETTLNNSIINIGSFSESTIAGYVATINGFQASVQGSYSAFLVFENNVKSFLRTYLLNEDSLLKQLNLLKKDREILKKSLSLGQVGAEVGYEKTVLTYLDQIKNLEFQIDIASNNLENAKNSKDITLKSLNNLVSEAQITYSQASKEYSKLTITSPISGVISKVFLDKGQEVNIGTPAFLIVNKNASEVKIAFDKKELEKIEIGMKIFTKYDGITYTGSISTISQVADENLKYNSTVTFQSNLLLIGEFLDVIIPVLSKNIIIPINIVDVSSTKDKGEINIFSGATIYKYELNIGKIFGDKLEVNCEGSGAIDCLNLDVILNDISSYDSEKFELKIK